MACLEAGNKSRAAIEKEFLLAFPESVGKSTFNVFFSDVVRPFGSASVSRDVRFTIDANGCLYIDRIRAESVKAAIARGLLKEISAVEKNVYPKKDRWAIDRILEAFGL